MKTHPAIALIELANIARGIKCADAMVKRSPIALMKTGTVSHGKYLILVGGTVAAVEEAFHTGIAVAGDSCLDSILLHDVHPEVYAALEHHRNKAGQDTVGIFETATIAANIEAADRAVKGAEVRILEMRLGDRYGGKAYTLVNGELESVQAAIGIAGEVFAGRGATAHVEIISNLHGAIRSQIEGPAIYDDNRPAALSDGEQHVDG